MMKCTSKYYYDENEKLTRMETYETYEKGDLCEGCEECDEGVLLEDNIELPCGTFSPLGIVAVVLSAIGLGVSIGKLLQDK